VHGQLAEQLWAALRSQDAAPFRGALTDRSTWELPGRSALAGVHRGVEAVEAVLRRLCVLRPIREDAYDVAASEYHAVLMTRLVGGGLDSDHVVVVVADDGGRLDRAFHYVFDLYAFDAAFPAASRTQ
jgi:ketosteroid isomerase-like protein